ncbi:hypothetical protein H0264_15425 [Nocardia huaxiensis]|uniref:Uncharacterized protein n=1 Tax=Nocardia huaxiensis TaxID=2755382 RepID=A0A7D6VI63_9NOCA|nr:hypothetical protein [Nocardia huaxiensis]QLY33435.1 hypothetical protein H0264_15425 [Nocardia huaxiensis]
MTPHLSIFARIEPRIVPGTPLNLEFKANGDLVRTRSDGGPLSGGKPSMTTNIFDDFKDRLNGETGRGPKGPKKIENLDRISIIDERTHALIAEFNRINKSVTEYGK